MKANKLCDDDEMTSINLAQIRMIYLHKLTYPNNWVDHLTAMKASKCHVSILISFSDLLVDIIRQLTDINDEDRRIAEKLHNASYRRFAFRQVREFKLIW